METPVSSFQGHKRVVSMSSEGLLTEVKTHVQRSVIYKKMKHFFTHPTFLPKSKFSEGVFFFFIRHHFY